MKTIHHWHNKSPQQTLSDLKTTPAGLSETDVKVRLTEFGPNQLPQAAHKNTLLRFFAHFHNVLIYTLLAAATITAILGHVVDTVVIIAVVIINAVIGFLQEGKAEKAMDAIRHMLALRTSVIREGTRQTIKSEQLVPGDIVILEAGDKVPADVRLLKTHGLQVQEAILTGESMAVEKHCEQVAVEAPLGDRFCIGYSGTTVTSGQGTGVVIATGAETEIGRISGLISEVQTLNTPLLRQMAVFAKWLTLCILAIAALILLFGYFVLQNDFNSLFMAVVGLSVAAIPEGLPAVLTITLAVGVQAMAQRNAIVRRLPAIETLGSVSVICSDKTGTLTRNEMKVTSIISSHQCFDIDGTGYEPAGDIRISGHIVTVHDHPVLEELGRAAVLCNDSALIREDNVWIAQGDPMEVALLAFGGKTGIDSDELRHQWTRTDLIPFDSNHKYMATLNHDHENHAFILVKGAPETVLAMCGEQYASKHNTEKLDIDYWNNQADAIAAQGQRVLAFAIKPVSPEYTVLEKADIPGSLIYLGLTGFIDPPRSEAIQAISECHRAGIEVKMITGDHATTAIAIGKQLGLQNSHNILTGAELDTLDDLSLKSVVRHTVIFARTSPEHKLRLVMALQANGMTVAMTGDGVNDAPALKRADVGVAMGKSGSEAAKEAAEIVLADDNFASIVAAVREGRTVNDNIKKVISWTLPTNAGEAMIIILALLLGLSLPITPIQILWVNMITAVTLGLSLAFEPAEENTMNRPPRPRNIALLSGALLWQILLVASLFLAGVFSVYEYAIFRGYSENLARTLSLNTLVVLEIFLLFFIRNMYGITFTWKIIRGTRVIWISIITVTIGQFSITYIPWLQLVFETEGVGLVDGLLIIGIGITMFVLVELEKQIRLRLVNKNVLAERSSRPE